MPDVPQRLRLPKLLIGEGREEVVFFTAFLRHLHLNDVQVEDFSGKQGLRTYLRALQLRPNFVHLVTLGIVRDADTHATSAFQSVCDALRGTSLVVPDGQGPGMLEDLCLAAVQTDPAMLCVNDYFQCLLHNSQHQPNNPAKARVHAWLASRPEPDLRLGEVAEKGYWLWDNVAFEPIKIFLQTLYATAIT